MRGEDYRMELSERGHYGMLVHNKKMPATVQAKKLIEEGRLGPGSNVLLVAFGAGFTWASSVIRW